MARITEGNQLIKELECQGFTVVLSKTSHRKVYRGGRLITTFAATPSDPRSMKNCLATLRRNGFDDRRDHRKKR